MSHSPLQYILKGEQNNGYVYQDSFSGSILRRYDRRRHILQKAEHRCKRLCTGQSLGRPMADGFRLRHLLFFCGYIRRLCRTVRLAFRSCFNMDWSWKCFHRLSARMERTRQTYTRNDTAS